MRHAFDLASSFNRDPEVAAEEFDVPLRDVHYDPTHLVFQGLYEASRERDDFLDDGLLPIDDDLPPAHITRGRPREDVPDGARVIHAGLCVAGDEHGVIPFFGHTVSGNENGHTAVAEQWSLLQRVVQPPPLTFFSDTGTYSFGHLDRLQQAGSHGVCPASWEDFRKLYDEQESTLTWRPASYLSLEQQRRRRQDTEYISAMDGCPQCRQPVRVPATAAAKKGRCPKCGGVFEIPARAGASWWPCPLPPACPRCLTGLSRAESSPWINVISQRLAVANVVALAGKDIE